MQLLFNAALAGSYKSAQQKIRRLSEHWLADQAYCPNCGKQDISPYSNNRPVADFFCPGCGEEYELKSQAAPFRRRVVDGAYKTMMQRLISDSNPNLFLLQYDREKLSVLNLLVIPKQFFIPEAIVARKPLAASARRAGWAGCYIALDTIPAAGRISLVHSGAVAPKRTVIDEWQRTLFLRDQQDIGKKNWLIHTMMCVERIGKREFSIADMYAFEDELKATFPGNQHVKEKIRQQMQLLRDRGYLAFTGRGTYRLLSSPPSVINEG